MNELNFIALTAKELILIKTKLNELPQLWNIFIGDMSIVGPRPALHNQLDLIEARRANGIEVLLPGITGWAQVNGRDKIDLNKKVKLDSEYLESQSTYLDIKIIGLTLLAVLGAKGSQLQLVLNTVFHLETSPGNIPWSLYQEVKGRGDVRYAIPYALGDNLYGYRIVGTTREIFDVFEFQNGEKFRFQGDGQPFDEGFQEAVLGSVVAEKLGLKRGDTFRPYHGLQYMPGSAPHQELYKITGVLEPTNTANDGVIWIPIEGIFRMDGHKLAGGTEEVERGAAIPDEWKEVSAVMLKYSSPIRGKFMQDEIRRGEKALEDLTAKHVALIEDLLKHKEAELLEI